jgi:hypothetical protein
MPSKSLLCLDGCDENVERGHKKTRIAAGFSVSDKRGLFDFAFFVDDVFTNHWVVFRHFHFVRRGFFVLVGGVKMTGTSRRDHADFIAFG